MLCRFCVAPLHLPPVASALAYFRSGVKKSFYIEASCCLPPLVSYVPPPPPTYQLDQLIWA